MPADAAVSTNAYASYTNTGTSDRGATNPLLNTTTFTLSPASPCIDAGADLSATFTTDYNGDTRPTGTAFDIGAYEFAAGGTVIGDGSTTTNSRGNNSETICYGDTFKFNTWWWSPIAFLGDTDARFNIFYYPGYTAVGGGPSATVTSGGSAISDASFAYVTGGTVNGTSTDVYAYAAMTSDGWPLNPAVWRIATRDATILTDRTGISRTATTTPGDIHMNHVRLGLRRGDN